MSRINVTKTFLPPREEYEAYLDRIWESDQLTNQGPLLHELEEKLKDYLGVPYLHFVANGTLALQLSLRALDITGGEVITTPFSYVATVSSILWERCQPVFVDIEPEHFCIDADKIEAAITPDTKAIMPVHVFGFPCETDKIEAIAKKHDLKVIYDAAHAFGINSDGKSLLDNGDISTCSFHATKLYHTIEGGCIIPKDKAVNDKVELMKRFGHHGDNHYMLGTNAKANEFQAAMGLANLNHIEEIIGSRGKVIAQYQEQLESVSKPSYDGSFTYNNAYYPVLFDTEEQLLRTEGSLNKADIYPRRYFYPSLNTLPYIDSVQSCPVSEDISRRILCLPLYDGLGSEDVTRICGAINSA